MLELLLDVKTAIRLVAPGPIRVDELKKGLGEQSLGDDTVCGTSLSRIIRGMNI